MEGFMVHKRRREIEMGDVVKQLGNKIHELRTLRRRGRMTQNDLAGRADISVSFLSMIERGERSPHLETLVKISNALDVEVADLFKFPGARQGAGVEDDPAVKAVTEFVRRHDLTRRDVDKLLGVAKALFPK
jgi:transcriptional regulator with XRE-family HTH domain